MNDIEKIEKNEIISFENFLVDLEVPKIIKVLLLNIWDLYKGKEKWTLANLKLLIKDFVDENEEKIRDYIEQIIETTNNE
ncbi:MAG: hypothetical protein ACTSQP_18835 [Promethearchaeota archaeon]